MIYLPGGNSWVYYTCRCRYCRQDIITHYIHVYIIKIK